MAQKKQTMSRTVANNYVKNAGKSLGYIAIGSVTGMNSTLLKTIKNTDEFTKDLYNSIKDFKAKGKDYDPDSITGQITNIAKEYKANLFSDLKTGKWYNQERSKKADEVISKEFGGDFDFDDFGDFDDDWNLDDDDSSSKKEKSIEQIGTEKQIAATQQSTSTIVNAMDKVSYRASSNMAQATIRSADYIVTNINSATSALYGLNSKGFSTISTGIAAVNSNMQALVSLAQPLTEHMQNSSLFYTKSTENQEKALGLLEQIANNTAPKSSKGYRAKGNKFTMSSIFDDGALNLNNWKDIIVGNVKSEADNLIGMLDMVGGVKGLGAQITASPIAGALSLVMSSLMPKSIKSTMENFNKTLGNYMKAMITKMKHKSIGNSFGFPGMFLDMFKDSLFPSSNYTRKYDNGNYEKGKVDWDGISRRALTEVIPTQLSKILSALTGEQESRYDYQSGKWKTIGSIRKERREAEVNAAESAGGYVYSQLKDSINAFDDKKLSKKQKEALLKQMQVYQTNVFHSNNADFMNVMKDNFDYKKYGLSEGGWNFIRAFANSMGKTGEGRAKMSDYVSNTLSGRDSFGESKRYNEYNGSMFSQLEDGTITKGHKTINLYRPKDEYGNDSLYYLRGILSYTGHIDQYLPMFINGSKDVKGFNPDDFTKYKMNGIPNSKTKASKKKKQNYDEDYEDEVITNNPTQFNNFRDASGMETINKTFDKSIGNPSSYYELSPEMKRYENDRMRAKANNTLDEFLKENKKNENAYKAAKKLAEEKSKYTGILSNKMNEFMDKHLTIKETLNKINSLIQIPTNTISDILTEVEKGMNSSIYGVKDGEHTKLYDVATEGVKNFFTTLTNILPNWLTKPFQDVWSWFKGTEFGSRATKTVSEEFGSIAKWFSPFRNTKKKKSSAGYTKDVDDEYYEGVYSDQYDDQSFSGAYAKGSRHARRGYAVVSEGEIIVPRKYKHFFGSFAGGGTAENMSDADMKKAARSQRYNSFKNAAGETARNIGNGLIDKIGKMFGTDDDKEKKAYSEKVKKAYSTIFDDGENTSRGALVGGLIGGGTSLLTGAVIGPLAGAALGAAVGITVKSKKVQAALFGNYDEEKDEYDANGLLPKALTGFLTKNIPSMTKGAGLGGVGGLLLGSPVLGAIAGTAVGFVNSSEKTQVALFGNKDKNGNYSGGIIPAKIINAVKKSKMPIGVGAIAGLLSGPFGGPVPNLILGSALGFATQSDKFQKWFFGDKGALDDRKKSGIYGIIKDEIANPIVGIVDKAARLIGSSFKAKAKDFMGMIGSKLANSVGGMIKRSRVGQAVSKVGGAIGSVALGAAGAPIKLLGKATTKMNDAFAINLLDKGINFKKNGKLMTAEERNQAMADYGMKTNNNQYAINSLLANSSDDQLSKLSKYASASLNTNSYYNGKISKNEKDLERIGLGSGSVKTHSQAKIYTKYLKDIKKCKPEEVEDKFYAMVAELGITDESTKSKMLQFSKDYNKNNYEKNQFSSQKKDVNANFKKFIQQADDLDNDQKKSLIKSMDGMGTEELQNLLKNIDTEQKSHLVPEEKKEEEAESKKTKTINEIIPDYLEKLYDAMSYIADSQYAIANNKPVSGFNKTTKNQAYNPKSENHSRDNVNPKAEDDDSNIYEDIFNEQAEGAAHGRKVTKTGVVAVSEGEMIIPSELNPFYHKPTNKRQQMINEHNAVKRFYGNYSLGGIVAGAGKVLSGVGSGISKVSGLFGNNSSGSSDSGTGETIDTNDTELNSTLDSIGSTNNNNPSDTNLNDNGVNIGTNAGRAAAKRSSMITSAISKIGSIPVLLKGIYNQVAGTNGFLAGTSKKAKAGILGGLLSLGSSLFSNVFSIGSKVINFFTKASKFFGGGSTLGTVIKDAASLAFVGSSMSGGLDNAASKIGYGKKNNSELTGTYTDENGNEVSTVAATNDDGSYVTNSKGEILDTNGNVMNTSSLSKKTTDKANYSQTFNQSIVRGFATNAFTGKAAGSLAGKMVGSTKIGKGLKAVGKTVKSDAAKLVSGGSSIKAAAGTTAQEAVGDAASAAVGSTFLDKCLTSIAKGLKKVLPKTVDVDGMVGKIESAAMDILDSAGAKTLKSIAAVAGKVLLVAEVVIDFTTGYQDASTILKVKKPSTGWKFIAAILRTIKNQIPIIGPLIPDDVIVDICADYIAPAMGMTTSDFQKQRDEDKAELAEYNEENGTDLSWSQYNKQVLGNTTWTEKLGNGVSTLGTKIKTGASTLGSNIKSKTVKVGTAISSVAKNAFSSISGFMSSINKDVVIDNVKQISKAFEEKKEYSKDGEITKLWKSETKLDKDNPLNFIAGIAGFIQKISLTVPTFMHAIGNTVSKFFSTIVDNTKTNYTTLNTSIDELKELSDKGSTGTILKSSYKPGKTSPLNGIFKVGYTISNFFYGIISLIKKISTPIQNGIDKVTGWLGNIGLTDSTGDTAETTEDTSNSAGGSFVSQRDSKYANIPLGNSTVGQNGCGPASAVMALNGSANMGDAINLARNYQTAGGTDASYFKEAFARNGKSASYITNKSSITRAVASGSPVVLMGRDAGNTSKSNSPFGPGNHYVVANGFDKSGNVIINDPESTGTRKYSSKILNNVSLGIGATGSGMFGFGGRGTLDTSTTGTAYTIYKYLVSNLGLTSAAACGVLGNIQQESGMNPSAQQNGGDYAIGIFQWAKSRKTALKNYASSKGTSWSDLTTQLEYFTEEINSNKSYKTMISTMNSSTNPQKNAETFEKAFERAGKPNMEARKKYAQQFYEAFSRTGISTANSLSSVSSDIANNNIGATATLIGSSVNGKTTTTSSSSTDSTATDDSSSSTDILSAISSVFTNAFDSIFSTNSSTSSDSSTTGTSTSDSATTGSVSNDTTSSTSTSNSATTGSTSIDALLPAIVNGKANTSVYSKSTSNRAVSGVSSDNSPAQNFINVARSQLGTEEGANNDTKYGDFTGAKNKAWCASFVSWCMDQAYGDNKKKAAAALRSPVSTASVQTLWDGFKNGGAMYSKPQPGDVIIYKNGTSHTGIVEDTDGNNFVSIEGNTSDGTGYSREGVMVNRKYRANDYSNITGFGRPNWDGAASAGASLLNNTYNNRSNRYAAKGTTSTTTPTATTIVKNNTSSSSGISKDTALLIKSMLTFIEQIVNNTSAINSIYSILVSKFGSDTSTANTQALSTINSALSSSDSSVSSEIEYLKQTVDQILA